MRIGTKSLLFGVHQVFIHPIFVAIAWWKLYGFPWDPRLWVAFVVHDWGYFGLPEMDGEIGDAHPYLGAELMQKWFDGWDVGSVGTPDSPCYSHWRLQNHYWYDFCLYHSRFLAKQNGKQPSRLCMADKLSLGIEPWWSYIPRAWLSGELKEYMKSAQTGGKHGHMKCDNVSPITWYKNVQAYLVKYAEEHKDGKLDTVTQIDRSDQV